MENYLVTNKTIAILKNNHQLIIFNVDKTIVINKNINKFLDLCCNYFGSSLDGRLISAKNILNSKYKIPIIIDSNIILIYFNSLRSPYNLFLVTNKILNYEILEKKIKIYCFENVNFTIKITKNMFEQQLLKSMQLFNVLNWRKSVNLL